MRIPVLVRLLPALLCAALAAVALPTGPVEADNPHRSSVQPLERAHAHNDYEHDRPLLDALDHGFTSVEADVWLVDGELYLGHDAPDLDRTLTDEYLRPLARRVRANGGSVYPHWRGSLRLLIDVKSEGTAAWPVIERELARFPQLFTTYVAGRVVEKPVTAVISGNRDLAAMRADRFRRSSFDGRLGDLRSGMPSSLVAMISDNWGRHFTWRGVGPMPAAERAKLHDIVDTAHGHGYDVRFWATPDLPGPARAALWRELVAAGVDVLNTDDLPGLQDFLLAEDPAEPA
ncbi:phosphatidylinositol-specific phospholipase C/glycerophosphodiester phosphodiesterase family protein [Nocardioides sp. SYSU DS0651]|uniref:phosphatidylinositol-specific phospholipase C/glycerophosphodiester phosphodiesterase family protein n=1 Tax=Nocardioides sp. SYSU DS0651 TaxID=3415955 RepID=UPI003F4BBE52